MFKFSIFFVVLFLVFIFGGLYVICVSMGSDVEFDDFISVVIFIMFFVFWVFYFFSEFIK